MFTGTDDGRAVQVPLHSSFEIRLETTPGTGHGWALSGEVPSRLEQVRDEVLPPDQAMPGARQIHVFEYRTLEAGPVQMRFAYRRPWEDEAEPERTYALDVEITD